MRKDCLAHKISGLRRDLKTANTFLISFNPIRLNPFKAVTSNSPISLGALVRQQLRAPSEDRRMTQTRALLTTHGVSVKVSGQELFDTEFDGWQSLKRLGDETGTLCGSAQQLSRLASPVPDSPEGVASFRRVLVQLTATAIHVSTSNYLYGGRPISSWSVEESSQKYDVFINLQLARLMESTPSTGQTRNLLEALQTRDG